MSTVINTNIASLTAQRGLAKSSMELSTALQRLSTGLRINSAKDDAAGLAIAERLTTQVRGYNQAIRNAGDGISLAQTAEGGMEAIANSLQRMRELAVQGANSTLTVADRAAIQAELTELIDEIDRVAEQTKFNDISLLNGDFTGATFQVGANFGESIDMADIDNLASTALKWDDAGTDRFVSQVTVENTAVSPASDNAQDNAQRAIQILDAALGTVTSARAALGATVNRFEQTISNLRVTVENVSSARSRIQDADFAAETAALTRQQILQQSGMAVLSQANAIPQGVLSLLR